MKERVKGQHCNILYKYFDTLNSDEQWSHARIERWAVGLYPSIPEKSQNIGFSSNTGQDPLIITKLPSQHSMLSHHRHASETPLKWSFDGRTIMASLIL